MAVSKVVNPNLVQTVTVTPVTSSSEDYYINVRNNAAECGVGCCGQVVDVYAIVKVTSVSSSNAAIITAGMPTPTHDIAFYCSPDASSKEPLRVFIGTNGTANVGKLQVRGGTAGATYSVAFTYIAAV